MTLRSSSSSSSSYTSPIVTVFFKIVGIFLFMNRVLFMNSTYKKVTIERDEDIYLKDYFCNKVNHQEIGRHNLICLQADRRLASSVFFHTLQELVNDTLYRELHFHTLFQVTGVVFVIMALGAFHTRYLKDHVHKELPLTRKSSLKID